jgi:uncharacterized protein YcgL (UPF0745 family)
MRFHEHYVSDGRGGSEMVSREPWPVTFDEFVAALAEKRYEAEVGGAVLDFSGTKMRFPTNRDARGALVAELQAAETVGASYRNVWVIGETAMEVTLEGLRQIVDAVNAHVRQCFAMQAEYLGLAKGGGITLDELHERMQTNWPGGN